MRCMVLRLIAMRPEGPAVRSPGRKAGEAPGRGKREYRRRALKARYFIQSAGVTAAPSALISQLQPNPGLTAGSTYCRPLGPQTNSVAILRQSRAVAHGYLYFFSILLGGPKGGTLNVIRRFRTERFILPKARLSALSESMDLAVCVPCYSFPTIGRPIQFARFGIDLQYYG